MRNYQREYFHRDCVNMIKMIGEVNRVAGRKNGAAINVDYGRKHGGRFYGIALRCTVPNCFIDAIDIIPLDSDDGFEVYVEGNDYYDACKVEYVMGRQGRHAAVEYIKRWLECIKLRMQGDDVDAAVWTNDFLNMSGFIRVLR